MMSFMLSAISASQISNTLAYILVPSMRPMLKDSRHARGRGYKAAVLGGVVLGAGMGYAGSCPGTSKPCFQGHEMPYQVCLT